MNVKNLFLGILSAVLIIYFSASFLYDPKYVFFVKPLIIPFFLLFIYLENKYQLSKKYLFFVLFFYLGETTLLFMDKVSFFYIIALVCYLTSYLLLISLCYKYIKSLNILEEIRIFELFIFSLIIGILVFVLNVVFTSQSDLFLEFIIVLNAISGILLVIVSFLYLKEIFNKKSTFFFFGAITIFLSDVISALNFYYLENFTLNFLERIMHLLGFYLIYLFSVQKNVKN